MNSLKPSWLVRLRFELRRYPPVHKPLQWMNRTAWPAMVKLIVALLRNVFPASSSLGFARGSYSDFDMVRRQRIEGRVVLTDQGAPSLPNPSIILLCQRAQHREQPWPVFWARHRSIRLIGSSLAHLDEQREICEEATYGKSRVSSDPAFTHFIHGQPQKLDGPWTSLISKWSANDRPQPFAHWLLDALPRLALLEEFP